MATLSVTNPTLLDLAKASDPSGRIGAVVEILNETNEILDDMTWMEGNLETGHRTTIRTGLPAPTWRKINGGVQPNKGGTAQITFNTGMLEAYAEIDKALADLNGNTAAFRLLEDRAHIEGISQEIADTLFYGNEGSEPEAFTGLSPMFNDLTAQSADNMIDGGSVGGQTDNASVWLVVWGTSTVHGIVPKGSTAGLQVTDKGQVTVENQDGSGGRMEAYRTHYRHDAGLAVRDWRYVVRIYNIDKSGLLADASTGANLPNLMFEALQRIPNLSAGRPVFYMSRDILTRFGQQMQAALKQSTLTLEGVGGRKTLTYQGIPIRRVDALSADETRIA